MRHPARRPDPLGTVRPVVLLLAGVASLAGGGCASDGPFARLRGLESGAEPRQITEAELADRIHRIEETFSRTAQSAADDIARSDASQDVVRRALAWRLHTVQALRTAVLAPDPQAAFLDVWVFVVQQRTYFRTDAARESFGDAALRVRSGVEECEREIQALGAEFLSPQQLESARKEVEAFAAKYSMSDAYARSGSVPTLAPAAESTRLDWIVSLPMAPFQMFSGIDEGAAAIRDFTTVADRFSRRVERIPQETAWELELMLLDTENRPAAQRTIGSLEKFSTASASLAATADRLPADVERAVDETLAKIDERHAKLDASLASADAVVDSAADALRIAQETVTRTEKPLADAAATAKSVSEAGEAWKGTIEAWHAMSAELYPPKDEAALAAEAAKEPGRPFDIREYEATAATLTGTAKELRGAIDSLRGLLEEADTGETATRLARMTKESAESARLEGEALVDHMFVRVLQAAAVVVAMGVVGVIAVRRWGRAG